MESLGQKYKKYEYENWYIFIQHTCIPIGSTSKINEFSDDLLKIMGEIVWTEEERLWPYVQVWHEYCQQTGKSYCISIAI